MICELNQKTTRGIVDEDLVIQDIELASMETSPSNDHMNMSEEKIQKSAIRCDTPSPVISDLDQETPRQCMETFPSTMNRMMTDENNMDSNALSEVQQDPIGCAPGINTIMKTIQKYMKNTMMSLLVMSFLIPWYFTLGAFSGGRHSGCHCEF